MKPIDFVNENSDALKPGSCATPFSTLIWAVADSDMKTVDSLLADDVEWGQMAINQVVKGKSAVIAWLKAGSADQKKPVVFSNALAKNWGVFEYWNIGTLSETVVAFGNKNKWPWPKDPKTLIGQEYKVAQCFVYHLNAEGKIDLIRQYLDAGSVWTQFK